MPTSTRRLLLLSAALAVGCPGNRNEGVVATVGDLVLSESDLAVVAERLSDKQKALESLVETALLAEGAQRRGLLRDPKVRAQADTARREVLAAALLERTLGENTSDAALRARYETNKKSLERRRIHVAHVVVHDVDGAQAKIATVLVRLRAAEAFEVVARELSDDKPSAARGGELPPIVEGQIEGAFFDAAVKLEAGQTSDVIKTRFGMHVIRALAAPESFVPPFEEVRGKLAAEAMQESRAALLKQLRESVEHTVPAASHGKK